MPTALTAAERLTHLTQVLDWSAEKLYALLRDQITPTVATGAATSGAVTMNARTGKVTSEALTTAQNAIYTLTITDSEIAAADIVLVTVANGTNTQGTLTLGRVTPAAGSVVITVINKHASAESLNGTIVVSFMVWKAAA